MDKNDLYQLSQGSTKCDSHSRMAHGASFQPLCCLPYRMLYRTTFQVTFPDSYSSGSADDPVAALNRSTWTGLGRQKTEVELLFLLFLPLSTPGGHMLFLHQPQQKFQHPHLSLMGMKGSEKRHFANTDHRRAPPGASLYNRVPASRSSQRHQSFMVPLWWWCRHFGKLR